VRATAATRRPLRRPGAIVEAAAPNRVDLAGGTLDIYPISVLEGEVVTVNLAIRIYGRVRLEPYPAGVALYSEDLGMGVEAPHAAALPVGGALDLVARAVRYTRLPARTRVVTRAEAPRGSGLGASSALLVALLAAGERRRGRRGIRRDLVDVAARLEAQSIAAPTGKQDYYAALYGGLNAIRFGVDGERVTPLLPPRRLNGLAEHLVLAFTGEPHVSGLTNWAMIKAYLDGVVQTVRGLRAIKRIAWAMAEALRLRDLAAAARLMEEEWQERRQLAEGVSTPAVERALEVGRLAGATAGKVCGAGGGGCVLLLVREGRKPAVEAALHEAGFQVLACRPTPHGLRLRVRRAGIRAGRPGGV